MEGVIWCAAGTRGQISRLTDDIGPLLEAANADML